MRITYAATGDRRSGAYIVFGDGVLIGTVRKARGIESAARPWSWRAADLHLDGDGFRTRADAVKALQEAIA